MSDTTDQILALEKRFWTEADNAATFTDLVLDDAIMVIEPMGFISKQQAVSMPAEKPWIDVEMSDVQVRQISPDLVILAYHGQGRHEGDAEPCRGSIASAYAKQDRKWRLALSSHQPWKPVA